MRLSTLIGSVLGVANVMPQPPNENIRHDFVALALLYVLVRAGILMPASRTAHGC
jgi:hypothetical protein